MNDLFPEEVRGGFEEAALAGWGEVERTRKGVYYEYTPFGGVVLASGGSLGASGEENSFRFSTKYQDSETGFYYYGYRHYNASLGRWLNRDPIAELGGISLYAMVANRIINAWDLWGLLHNVTVVTTIRKPHSQAGEKSEHSVYADSKGNSLESHSTGTTDIMPGEGKVEVSSRVEDFNSSVAVEGNTTTVQMDGTTGSWFVPANIDYDLTVTIDAETGDITVTGSHDGFPSYTVIVDGEVVYDHQQQELFDLFGSEDIKVDTSKKDDCE